MCMYVRMGSSRAIISDVSESPCINSYTQSDYTAPALAEVSDLIQRRRVKCNLLFPSTHTHTHTHTDVYSCVLYLCTSATERVAVAVFQIMEKRTIQQRDSVFPLALTPSVIPLSTRCGLRTTHKLQSPLQFHERRIIYIYIYIYLYTYIHGLMCACAAAAVDFIREKRAVGDERVRSRVYI